jgi:alanine racemase
MQAVAPKTWIEVSAAALRANMRELRRLLGPNVAHMAVVKANAYGHGIPAVVDAVKDDADWFGVFALEEALAVRTVTDKPILILGGTIPENLPRVIAEGFSQTCSTLEAVVALSAAATPERPAKVHVKIETGTSRQGIHATDLQGFLGRVKELPNVRLEGAYTHFANIEDTTDDSYSKEQLARFDAALETFAELGMMPEVTHTACSAAVLLFPPTHRSMVRTGIAMYGLWPSGETRVSADALGRAITLTPALTWKTRIIQVKPLAAGTPVSYGLTETVKRDSRIAVLPTGYWDGYDRGLSSVGEVLIRGKRAKVLGRVCMNMTVVDVTDIPDAKEGDEVVLLGRQGNETVTAEEIGRRIGTINYEVVTRINPLLPRVVVA